jgi:hypothetical protein
MADVKLCINETGLYYYPDLMVSCHPQDLNARKFIQFPEKISAECYRRGEGRMWLYYPYTSGDSIVLESLEITVSIEELYTGIEFDPKAQMVSSNS